MMVIELLEKYVWLLERTPSTTRIIYSKLSASTLSYEVVQYEKEKSSSSDSPLSFVQNLPVISSESEEEFDFSPSNVVASVMISITLYFFRKNIIFSE